ncbi:hypothetical protein C0J52_02487 [Blattella germanica]|nr:hypothetical protein C0J52_02487 [Blattella germanica]
MLYMTYIVYFIHCINLIPCDRCCYSISAILQTFLITVILDSNVDLLTTIISS